MDRYSRETMREWCENGTAKKTSWKACARKIDFFPRPHGIIPPMTDQASRLSLERVRIQNYKCLEDVELPFGDLTLLAGRNGTGKSAVFEVLYKLRLFIGGGVELEKIFPSPSLNRRSNNCQQSFRLKVSDQTTEDTYEYSLCLENGRVQKEDLLLNDESLFEGFSSSGGSVVRHYSSAEVQNFCDWVRSIVMLAPSPATMHGSEASSGGITENLKSDGGNFARWYLTLMQKKGGAGRLATAKEKLGKILPGFQDLYLGESSDRIPGLVASFQRQEGGGKEYMFHELSSGQCVLIALYALIFGGEPNRLLLLDEPDNFVTLPEIQPLLSELKDEAGDELPQTFLISHHPEAIDFIAPEDTAWFEREAEGCTRVKKFKNDTRLRTSELFAREMAP